MKELPGSWNPVAVFHSNKSCCKLRTIVSEWKQGRGLLRVPWSLLTWGNPSPAPAVFLALLAPWELTGHVSGSWRVNHNWMPLIQFRGLALVRLLSPFSLWGTERIKRRGGEGVAFGENFLPTEELHFLPNPLLSFVASSSFSIRSLKDWVVRAWMALWTLLQGGLQLLRSASGKPRHPRLLSDVRFGQMASKPLHWSAPQCTQVLESSLTPSRGSCLGRNSVGHTPLHFSCQEATGMGKFRCQVPLKV